MDNCCYKGYNKTFNLKGAKRELRRYQKKGAKGSTRVLIDFFATKDLHNKSLLDIGGGIGVIQLELLKKGLHKVSSVDASQHYLDISKQEAIQQGMADKVDYQYLNFVEAAKNLGTFEIVTLDKVVCCYDDYNALIDNVIAKSNTYIALSAPRDGFIPSILSKTLNFVLNLFGNPYQSYIHSLKAIESQITDAGFELKEKKSSFPWFVYLYEKK